MQTSQKCRFLTFLEKSNRPKATVSPSAEAAAPSVGKTLALLIKAPTRPSSLIA